MSAIAGILLAAGGSTRMGRPKQFLPYRGAPLVVHAARTLLASVCRPIVVVTGANAGDVQEALNGLDVAFVHNARWNEGLGTSIAVAVEHLSPLLVRRERDRVGVLPDQREIAGSTEPPPQPSPGVPGVGARGALIALCDQPLITPDLLDTLVRTFETGDHLRAVACAYGGTLGVPAVFGRELFGELLDLAPLRGAKTVLQRHAERVAGVPFDAASVDVDTPQQYSQLEQR